MSKITTVIDIGSNSMRMVVLEKSSRFAFSLINETKSRVKISEGCYENGGNLQEIPMERAYQSLKSFLNISNALKSRKVLCVATSALRDAPNSKVFLNRVKNDLGLSIKVIDGEKESYFGGVATSNLLHDDEFITIDIGGGSTEFCFVKDKKILKSTQVSQSSFSHFVLSSDKKSIFVADESGIISELNTSNLEKIGQFKGQNVDRVFQVDFKENTILACGQDRRASIYYKNQKKPYYKSIDFLVYAGALDDKAKKAAISLNEDNDVLVFDIDTKEELFILKGNNALITSILFLDENSLVVASDDKKVNIYNLKKD